MLAQIEAGATRYGLSVFGGFHPAADDDLLPEIRTLLLLGPLEPGFWPRFVASPEWQDRNPDPMDRWSHRVVTRLAREFGAQPLFPFGGPPHLPFYDWAVRTGRAWASPVSLLVHDRAGLMVSYRGALAFSRHIALPVADASPCHSCTAKPCLSACPASALTGLGYDLSGCHGFLDSTAGQDCMSRGCAVRRACPASQTYARLDEQSAYHMGLFHQ